MDKRTTAVAVAVTAFAIACNPIGEGSAADQQEEKKEFEPAPLAQPSAEPGSAQGTQAQPGASSADNVRAAGELRVAEITSDPDARVNQSVTVVGEVEDMLGAHAFKLNDEAPLAAGADHDIVVLGTQRATWTMSDAAGDARMRVRGKLVRVPAADLERSLGWTFDDKLAQAVGGERVVLIAEQVERLEGGEQQRETQVGQTRGADEREPVRGEQEQEAAPGSPQPAR